MEALSISFTQWHDSLPAGAVLDAVVIGSGYGGSVAALRMAELGLSVVVLERGSEYLPGEFPNDVGQLPKHLRAQLPRGLVGRASGLFDWRIGPAVVALGANGLGGGSLINAGVMMKPTPEVFSQPAWPQSIRLHGDKDKPSLDDGFAKAESELKPRRFEFRNQADDSIANLPKSQALKRMGEALRAARVTRCDPIGIAPAKVTIDLNKCTQCGDCFTGCNVEGAKLTLRDTYLAKARHAGAVIVTGALVWSIRPHKGTWVLRCIATERSTYRAKQKDAVEIDGVRIRARRVVVAAGTFGSTELLQRSVALVGSEAFALSPALGTRFSTNGDSLSASADEEQPVDALGHGAEGACATRPVGPTITTVLDMRSRPDLREQLVIQDGAVPGALVGVYQEGLALTWMLQHIGARWRAPRHAAGPAGSDPLSAPRAMARHAQLLLTMGHDDSSGRIVRVDDMDASVPFWASPEEAATYKWQEKVFKATERNGSRHLQSPLWQLLPKVARTVLSGPKPQPFALTVHPLGGCPMADCFEAGVVDDQGRVWRAPNERWANLWVLDGSIVPTSLGCNPLWTITALAERAMAHLTKDAKAMSPGSVMPKAPSPVPREPMPLVREAAPRFAVRLSERLEMRELPVRGALRKAFSPDARVDAGLTLNMSTPDWRAVWDHPDHCFDQISGRLRLVASREEPADDEQLVYDIASGQVCLLAEARSLPLIGWLLRVDGTIRAAASWWILRGRRDSAMTRRREGLSSWQALVKFWPQRWAMLRIWWQGGTERQVRYALTLQRTGPAGAVVGGPDAPATLRLHGVKRVSYAATWCQLAVYLWRSLLGWLQGAPRQHPADLRPAYVDQLTRPVITLMEPGWRSLLPGRKTQARFEFDPQRVLQKSPVDLFGGGDSSAAMIALMAYPLLVLRHALQTRVLDFRLPDYSGRPVVDGWDTGDVSLRAEPAGTARPVHPELHVLKVRRGRSSSDDATEDGRLIRLPLWRYRRPDGTPSFEPGTWNGEEVRRVRSVLLMHAFAMSGSTYTLKTIPCNLAEYLYAKGYEVWVLDTRMSPRVEGSLRPGTLDQVGLIDAPAAVDKILELLEADLVGVEPGAPLQIFSFAHCFGAGAMLMGLLGGKLSYPPPLNHPAGAPLMPKLAGLVCSQVHPFMVGSRRSQAKTWIPAFVRDAAARMTIPLAVRTAAPTILEALVDRLFASMPVPSSERCPKEGYVSRKHEDDCATCRRIRFLDGDLFKHKHLNPQTHDLLTSLFGDGSVRLFAHGARIVEYERLVTEDGLNAYATDEAMARYLALPMRFVHGKDNDLFDKESATRSAEQFRRIQPAWSEQFKLFTGRDEPADLIDDYGHLDILIGEHAHKEVYPRLVGLFDAVLRTPAQPCAQPPVVATQLQVRFPKLGPWIGPVRTNGTWSSVDLAFVIDDMRTEASLGAPGSALVATAIVSGLPGGLRAVPMPVQVYKAPILARDGFAVGKLRSQLIEASVVRVARATIRFPAQTRRLSIEMVSHARAPVGPISPFGRGGRPTFREAGTPLKGELDLEPAVTAELSVQPGLGDAAQLSELRHAIAQACRFAWQARKAARQPFPASHSQLLQNPIAPHRRRAVLLPHALQALGPPDPVRIAVGCCRYPGFPFDRGRADAAFKRLLALQSGPMEGRVRLGMMLGDQIYADATAGYVDPLSPVERYVGRHMNAFHSPAVQRLMTQLPMVLAPDDHEFGNDYPNGPPLFGGTANGRADAAVRNMWRRKAAIDAIAAFQQSAFKLTHGVGTFETGAVRYLVLDSRTDREPVGKNPFQILTKPQLQAIRHWVKQGRKTKQFHVLCSGSVIWPSLVPDGDPGNRGPDDSWREASIQRARLLELLASRLPGRFAVVSGDYHVSFAGLLAYRGEPVGVCIVAPPFYAPLPYANAAPHELDWKECLALPGGSSLRLRELSPVKRGSGYGVLTIQQREKAWEVAFAVDLLDMETGADWTGLKPMAKWRL